MKSELVKSVVLRYAGDPGERNLKRGLEMVARKGMPGGGNGTR
jgi:hypothetical protein